MATHSSTLAWTIPRTEEPGGLQSMGSLRVRHDWATSFHFSLSRIGEGNGNPLQCSCLENPRDRGTWWAADYGVAQSQTRLKWLSSSSSSMNYQADAICFYSYFPPRAKAMADVFSFFCFSFYWWEDFFSTLTFPLKSFTLISTVKSFAMQRNMETQASNYDMNIWGVGGDNYSLLVGGNNFPSVTN